MPTTPTTAHPCAGEARPPGHPAGPAEGRRGAVLRAGVRRGPDRGPGRPRRGQQGPHQLPLRGKRGLYVAILDSAFAAMAERLKAIEAEAPERARGAPRLRPGLRADDAGAPRLSHPLPARGALHRDRAGRAAPPPRDHRRVPAPRRARGARGALPPRRSPPDALRAHREPRLLLRHRAGPPEGRGGGRRPVRHADGGRVRPLPRGADPPGARPRGPVPPCAGACIREPIRKGARA